MRTAAAIHSGAVIEDVCCRQAAEASECGNPSACYSPITNSEPSEGVQCQLRKKQIISLRWFTKNKQTEGEI